MYLFIFEDGSVMKRSEVQADEVSACESGYLDIINITNPEEPLRYIEGKWVPVENVSGL